MEAAQWRQSFHRNVGLLGYDRRVEWEMLGVTEHQLQRVLAGRQVNSRLSLPRAEMKMCLVLGDGLVWVNWVVHIDQQMMMTAVWGVAARLGDAHAAKAKPAPKGAFYSRAVSRPNNVNNGVGGRVRSLRRNRRRYM